MQMRNALIKLFSIRLFSAVCASMMMMMVMASRVCAAELVTGMNTNIQVWSDPQRDALIDQLVTGKVKVIRCGFHNPPAFYLDFAKRLYDKGIKIDLLVGCGYPASTHARPKSTQYGMRAADLLSLADPEISKKNFQTLFDDLDKQGIVLEGVELGNEFNWADFNGDFPVPGQGRIFEYDDLTKDPEAKQVAKGFLQYLSCLAALKEVRDHSHLNKNTPIVLGGLVYFHGWPPPKQKLDGVSLDATMKFLKAHGLDKLVDIYGIHCYPKEPTAAARKSDVDAICAYGCPPNSNAGKPCWLTEWGVTFNPDEDAEAKSVKELMRYFEAWTKKDRLLEVIYFSWNYYGANQKNPVFRDGKLQPVGKAALEP